MGWGGRALLARALSIFVMACQSGGPPRDVQHAARRSMPATAVTPDGIDPPHSPGPASTPTPSARVEAPALPPPERPVEISLPRPVRWVEASMGVAVTPGYFRARSPGEGPRQCASVWFDEDTRVDWVEGGGVSEAAAPMSSAFGRGGAYHDAPTGQDVVCHVTDGAELRCRPDECFRFAATLPPDRCHARAHPGRRSEVQRTRGFVPTRHWIRTSPFERQQTHACLRTEGRVRCYPLHRDVPRPSPVSTPELDAWTDVRDLSGAASRACAVLGDGSVHCWGMPYLPETGSTYAEEEDVHHAMLEHGGHPWVPRRIEGLPPVVQVSVGLRTTCARTDDGRVFCWGAPECLGAPSVPRGRSSPPTARLRRDRHGGSGDPP